MLFGKGLLRVCSLAISSGSSRCTAPGLSSSASLKASLTSEATIFAEEI